MMNITSETKPETSSKPPTRIGSELRELFGPIEATMWLHHCEVFWAWLDGQPQDKVVATLPARSHREALAVLDQIGALVKEYQRRFWEAGRPKLVGKEGGDQTR